MSRGNELRITGLKFDVWNLADPKIEKVLKSVKGKFRKAYLRCKPCIS